MIIQNSDLVKERASIEKEYIHKLENLQKKCVQKSEKRGLTLSIGTVKAQNGDTTIPNISTFQQVYDKFLTKFDDTVKERNEYVTKLNTLSDNIKAKIAKKEELRKKHMDYYTKINTEVSNMSAETDKNESKFREACNNTDALKKKCDRSDVSNDDKKSKKNLDQSIIDMNNKKNAYILSIKVSNAYNDKLINVENHNILDNMQEFHESAVDYYKSICNEYLENENELCQNIEGFNEEVVEGNNQIDTPNDIQLYIKYNRPRDWRKPEVKTFASISLWDIKDNIYTNDANAITFLRNTLLKLQQNLSIHKDDIATKNKELDGISTMIQTYKATPSFGDSDDVLQKYIDTKKEIALLQLEELKCEVQINAITEAIGCDQMSIVPHNFKNKKIINKAICSLCGESLWGKCLSCKECGYLCHTKCELNVPPNCTKVKLPKNKRGSVNSVNSLPVNSNERNVTSPTSAKNPFMDDDDDDDDCNNSNPFSSSSDINLSGLQTMVAIYDYTKQNADEINLRTGEEVTIIENDKGDGWVKVSCSSGTGLVPANYLEPVANNLPNYTTSSNNHTSFLSNLKKAKVIYDYQGQVDEELTVTQDEIVTFIENSEPGWIK
eukprot:jgi/Orpsp1_1/1185124/evm.model.c7180000092424.1